MLLCRALLLSRAVYRRRSWVYALVVLSLSCSGEVRDGRPAAEACQRRAKARCARIEACSNGYRIAREFSSMLNCELSDFENCIESVTRTGSGYEPEVAFSCAVAFERQSCAERSLNGDPPECGTAKGRFENARACISSNQCVSKYCDIPPGKECGICANRIAQGGVCETSTDCQNGLFCQREGQAVTGSCLRLQAELQPCNDTLRCDTNTGLLCAGRDTTAMVDGACRKTSVGEGGSCNTIDRLCVSHLTCTGAQSRAGQVISEGICGQPLMIEGEPCDRNARLFGDCDNRIGLYCFHVQERDPMGKPIVAPSGFCRSYTLTKVGQPCGRQPDGITFECETGRSCVRPPLPDGKPNWNAPGSCSERAAEGQPCNTNSDIGPTCLQGNACVLLDPGRSTEGTCRRRKFELLCGLK